MTSNVPAFSQDVVYDIFSSPRRRYALYHLRQAEGAIELTTLAEYVAAWEEETAPDALSDQERKRVYVSLYQTHIPKLEETGMITYDEANGTVELEDDAAAADEYLRRPTQEVPWHRIYLALTGVGALLLVLGELNVSIFSAVPGFLIAGVVIAGFVVVSMGHYREHRQLAQEVPEELRRKQ